MAKRLIKRSELWLPPHARRTPSTPPTGRRFVSRRCCCGGLCATCSGAAPASFDVTFTGITDDICTCDPSINTTYTVTDPCFGIAGGNPFCHWRFFGSLTTSCIFPIRFVWILIAFTGVIYTVTARMSVTQVAHGGCFTPGGTGGMSWLKELTSEKPVCSDFLDLELTQQDVVSSACEIDSSTCKVTAN